ncbi:hypothetical protein GOP47_0018206 [Adiantum capillus-veneris]|uniref:Uncharacterized protein n=1 Tax=Adiantum capillus-veneris TaxID=13818 RepID=A0A9D4UGU4_ADICA|nr:hypothetical protein GOP47_0018206 [Adiantum capillus-veneris]
MCKKFTKPPCYFRNKSSIVLYVAHPMASKKIENGSFHSPLMHLRCLERLSSFSRLGRPRPNGLLRASQLSFELTIREVDVKCYILLILYIDVTEAAFIICHHPFVLIGIKSINGTITQFWIHLQSYRQHL